MGVNNVLIVINAKIRKKKHKALDGNGRSVYNFREKEELFLLDKIIQTKYA